MIKVPSSEGTHLVSTGRLNDFSFEPPHSLPEEDEKAVVMYLDNKITVLKTNRQTNASGTTNKV